MTLMTDFYSTVERSAMEDFAREIKSVKAPSSVP